jgi:predicted P-loop ATPase
MRYTEIFKEARRLHSMGMGVLWLHPKSKRPVETGWTKGDRQTWEELEATYRPGYNLGVRTGQASSMEGGYLACIDVDIKDEAFRKEALARLKTLLAGNTCPEVRSGSGQGSRHLYCVTASPFKMITVAKSVETYLDAKNKKHHKWEICVYSTGRQMVLPPSVHPDSGKLYAWKTFLTKGSDLPLMTFQTEEADRPGVAGNAGVDGEGPGSVREAHTAAERSEAASLDFKIVKPVELAWLPISDEVRQAITKGVGVTDRSGYLLRASSALVSAGLSVNEVLNVLTDPNTFLGACAYEHAGNTKSRRKAAEWVYRYTLKKVSTERDASNIFTQAHAPGRKLSAEEMEEQAEEFAEDRTWRQELDRNKEGKTKVTLKNLDLILTNRIEGSLFVEDLFASRIEYGVDTPWGGKAQEYIKDIDMTLIKRWLADTEFGIEPSKDAMLEATALLAHRCKVHPVREWLSGLKWDGVSRADTWIKKYCQGFAAEPYLSEISRKFLLAMVKRVFEPGCQWDYVIVLEGKQGKYKSSIARALASDKWFMDNLPDLKDKDSMLNLQGKWLIELGELADVKRADYNLVKAYLVRRTDTVRPHYGRLMTDVPRQSVFIGTINEGQYLKDPTGNRRYWPVRVGLCNVEALTEVRDQLFAEAMHLYRTTNEKLMLGEEATVQATEAQEERRVDDDESEMRSTLIDFIQSEKSDGFNFESFRARDLMIGANTPWGAWNGKGYVMNIAAQVLANMGFTRGRSGSNRKWQMDAESLFNNWRQHVKRSDGERWRGGAHEEDEIDFR